MTKEQLAKRLNGREIGNEITEQESDLAKKHGLLVVYGASDDLVEFSGCFCDEANAYEGATCKLDRKGLLKERDQIDDDEELKDFFKREPKAAVVEAIWDRDGYSWTYKTALPHAAFEIVEDGEKYCRGIVIDASDLPRSPK